MTRVILTALFSVATATALWAEAVPLGALSRYLDDLQTARAAFTQTADDGAVSTGDLYLHRPGRMRFDYDGGELLVIAGGGRVAIFDGRSNTRPEQYPLKETPLNLILARDVDLTGPGIVLDRRFDGAATRVTIQDPERPEIGFLELVFTGDPVELREWIAIDSAGGRTAVVLDGLEEGVRLPARLFNIPLEIRARTPAGE